MTSLTKIMIIVFLLMFSSKENFVEVNDQNIEQLEGFKVSFILFTLKKHPAYNLIRKNDKNELNQYIRDKCGNICTFRQAELSQNTYLQQKFNIKRFPYFGAIIKQKRQIFYRFRGIVTIYQTKKFIKKVILYLQYTNQLKVQKMQEMFPMISLNMKTINLLDRNYFLNHYYLNDLFSQIYFYINQTSTSENQIVYKKRIGDKPISYMVKTISQIKWSFEDILFSQINEFSQDIYNLSMQLTIKRYIFMVALDSIGERQKSYGHLNTLNKVFDQFDKKILIFWMEVQINKHKKVLMGFSQSDQAPLVSLFLPQGKQKIVLKQKFTYQSIYSFIQESVSRLNNRWIEKAKGIIQTFQNEIIIKVFSSEQKYKQQQNKITIEFKDLLSTISYNNIIEAIKSIKKINRYVWQKNKQFFIILKEIKNGQEIIKINRGLTIIQLNIQILDICSLITQTIDISLPKYVCVEQKDLEEYLFKTQYDDDHLLI